MSKASDLFVFTPSMEEVIEAIDELLPDGSAKTLRRALAAHDDVVRAEERERIARNIVEAADGEVDIFLAGMIEAVRIAREGA
ncbi:MAG: hypothetical protein K0S70_188 [Microbacterium sp.]|jgi:hypothetical protein|nr:hypothetical protein [Microbacterium sp.]